MIISRLQNQNLVAPISVEGALLELLQMAETSTTATTTGQASTTFNDDTMTASLSLPIFYTTGTDGTIIVQGTANSFPDATVEP